MSELALLDRRTKLVESKIRGVSIVDLAKQLGVPEQTLYNDWHHRGEWLPKYGSLAEREQLLVDTVAQWDAAEAECWRVLQEVRERGGLSALNGAVKNLRETLAAKAEVLQSLGCLPRVASEQHVEIDKRNLTVECESSEQLRNLVAAAGILNSKERGAAGSGQLH